MDLIDLLIILFVISSLLRGYRIGLVRQAGSTIGFVAGLFAGSFLSGLIIGHEGDSLTKSLTSVAVVLFLSFLLMSVGELIGIRLKRQVRDHHSLDAFDGSLGSVMAIVTLLLAVWLVGGILLLGSNGRLQQELKSSRILATLNRSLPPATEVLSSLNKLIDPNGFPEVFRGLEPNPGGTVSLPPASSFSGVVAKAQTSVVKVEGTGCGGIVEGSGFVFAKGEIVTNAHVVAGVANPKVIDANGIHDTRVVWFDPNVDLAVLKVRNLAGQPLRITSTEEPQGTPAAVLGYPGGGDFNAQTAAIIDHFSAYGRNIYGQGTTVRDIYSVQAHVIPGNSGGPLIGRDGTVLGIVFATSTTYNDVGYALTGHQVAGELAQATHATKTVGTGQCSE